MRMASQYSSEMNDIQNTALEGITACRDEIECIFGEHASSRSVVDHTLERLFSYQSDRSQTISFLLSENYWWDCEILMRSFYETHAKIWYICQAKDDKRDALVEEFWGSLADLNARKKADRAKPGAELFSRQGRASSATILSALTDEHFFNFHKGNKKERKSLEQKWSFSEILKNLEENDADFIPLHGVSGLKHMYGQQSHLIHADESALDLMLDRQLRNPAELELLVCSHACRIFSDQLSLWAFSTSALRHRFNIPDVEGGRRWELWKKLHTLTEPFSERFAESQKEFYERVASGN